MSQNTSKASCSGAKASHVNECLEKDKELAIRSTSLTSKGDASKRDDVKIVPRDVKIVPRYNTRSRVTASKSVSTSKRDAPNREGQTSEESILLGEGEADRLTSTRDALTKEDQNIGIASKRDALIQEDQNAGESTSTECVEVQSTPTVDDVSYNFKAVVETPPRDYCMARSCFTPALNESAEEYIRMRERRRLRQLEADLLMGMLGTANQDEVITVPDIREFTENKISSLGISKVTFDTQSDVVKVHTEGVLQADMEFNTSELPSAEETLVFNGKLAPYPTPRSGKEEHVIAWNRDVLTGSPCTLCATEDSLYQFNSRHRKANLKHWMAHSYSINPRSQRMNTGRILETLFDSDVTLQNSNHGRRYNFLPSATNLEEAVQVVCEDDHIPSVYLLTDYDVILAGLECISSLSLERLLAFYYCLVSSTYAVRGSVIRHVQMCRRDIPALPGDPG